MDIQHLSRCSPVDQMETMIPQFQTKLPQFYLQTTSNNFTDDTSSSSAGSNMSLFIEDSHFSSIIPSASAISVGETKPLSSWRKRKGGEITHDSSTVVVQVQKRNMAEMREMFFKISALQPVEIDPESVKAPKRRNVKISKDPQSVAARHRRERISERIRILQRLVPGGTQMDTASMLDEAIHYMKFLKNQIELMEKGDVNHPVAVGRVDFPVSIANGSLVHPWEYQERINYLQYG